MVNVDKEDVDMKDTETEKLAEAMVVWSHLFMTVSTSMILFD